MVDSTDRTSHDTSEAIPDNDGPSPEGQTQPLRYPPLTRRDIFRRVVIGVAIIAAVAGIYFTGRAATTGLDSTSDGLPDSVDRLIPASGDEVLRQAQVGIDVATGHDAYLIVNGVEIRTVEDGLIKDLGTGQILVQPGVGKTLESLNEGRNCVVAMVWESLQTETTASPVSWCFDAT